MSRKKTTPRKPHGDSHLVRLAPGRADELEAYLLTHTLEETVAWLGATGVVTSKTALSNWLTGRQMKARLARMDSAAQAHVEHNRELHPDWTQAELQAAGQRFFTQMAIEQGDPQIWRITQQLRLAEENLALKHQALALQERRVQLLETKAAQADKTSNVLSEPLSPDEQLARIRQVYGIA